MSTGAAPSKRAITVGDTAPDFTLPTQTGAPFALRDLIGRGVVVLYFYPKDNSSGCTAEACAFRDSYAVFKDAGAEVVGVSSDPVTEHGAFVAKNNLPFTLLSDTGGAVRKRYGVPSTLGLLPGRVTYVIDRAGVVRHVFNAQLAATKHVREALQVVETLRTQG